MKKRKVFGLGFHRTGTTSLQTALEELGYQVVGMRPSEWDAYERNDFANLTEVIACFDAFRDMPWPLMYRWLDEKYLDAQFILTLRDPEDWVSSCAGNYKEKEYRMFQSIYGFNRFLGNEERAIQVYNKHLLDVREYFEGREGKILEIDLTENPKWESLCEFLGEPVPDRPFPHANRRPKTLRARLQYLILRKLFPRLYRKVVRDL